MNRTSHTLAGWGLATSPTASDRKAAPRSQVANAVTKPAGLWKYRTLHRSRGIMALSILFSLGLHALALLGFNQRHPVVKRASVADDPVIQMTMPDLQEDKIDPVDALGEDQPPETPAIAVPMLADLPTLVPIDSFVQPLDFTPALPAMDAVRLAVIPTNVARNSGSLERLGKIFDVSQLDRQPEPIIQPSPVFPPELMKVYPESTVKLEFIITSRGEVVAPSVITSEHGRFADAAIRAVDKWKFRPGFKAGRPVNTRTQIAIHFLVTKEN